MPKVYEEACQLYIEQEIEEGLKQGKTAYSVGMEISKWVEKFFGRKVKADTIKKKMLRMKTRDNVPKPKPTPKLPTPPAPEPVPEPTDPPEDLDWQEPEEYRLSPESDNKATPEPEPEEVFDPNEFDLSNYQEEPPPSPVLISQPFKKAWEELYAELSNEKLLGWKTTSREIALEWVNDLIEFIQKP